MARMVAQNLLIHLPGVKSEPGEPFQGFPAVRSDPLPPEQKKRIIIFNCVIKPGDTWIVTAFQRKGGEVERI